MHLVVVIPAHNESRVIKDVINSIPRTLPGIKKITPLVIDDHSQDLTQKKARQAGAICLRQPINLGVGGTTVTGLEAAKMLDADIIVTMDGDGQHDGADMVRLIRPLLRGEAEVAIGSRLLAKSEAMPAYKVLGNNLLNFVTFCFFGIWVSDSQSGYKAFTRKALETIELSTSGYELCSEIIGEIKAKHLPYVEVPITTIYTDYSKSKGQLALNAVNIVLGLIMRGIR